MHQCDPSVFMHVALVWQLWVLSEHSSTSLHTTPLPLYPVLHVHPNDPTLLEHVALAWQLWVLCEHSFSSLHFTGVGSSVPIQHTEWWVVPLTVSPIAYPDRHTAVKDWPG